MKRTLIIPTLVVSALLALALLTPTAQTDSVEQYVVVFSDSRTWNVVVKDDGELFRLYKTELIGSTFLDMVSNPHNHTEISQVVGGYANKPVTQLISTLENRG